MSEEGRAGESEKETEVLGAVSDAWWFTVELAKVRELTKAVFDDHRSGEYPPVPPTYPIYGLAEMQHAFFYDVLKLDRSRVLNGGQQFEYRRPLRIGDRLVCTGRVAQEYEKEGRRGGRMRFIVIEIEMRDAVTQDPVGISRSTVIELQPGEGAASG